MVEYYAYSIYHGQAAALGGRDRTHGLAVVLLNNHVHTTHTTSLELSEGLLTNGDCTSLAISISVTNSSARFVVSVRRVRRA